MMQNTDPQALNITSLREWAGLTQVALAEALGVSQPFLSQVESGAKPFPADREEDLIRVLNEARAQREFYIQRMQLALAEVSR